MSSSSFSKETFWQVYWRMLKRSSFWLTVFLVATVFYQVFYLVQPFLLRSLVNAVSDGQTALAQRALMVFLGSLIIARAAMRIWVYADRKIVPPTYIYIETYGIESILRQSYEYFVSTPSGQIMTKVKNLALVFERFFGMSQEALTFFLSVPVTFIALAYQGFAPLIAGLFYVVFGIAFTWTKMRHIKPLEREKADARARFVGAEADVLTQAQTVLLFHAHKREGLRLFQKGREFVLAWQKRANAHISMISAITAASLLFEVVLLLALYRGWMRGVVRPGDFVLYQSLAASLVHQVFVFSKKISEIQDGFVQAEEAMAIIQRTPEVVDAPKAKALRANVGEIVFDRVQFTYGQNGGAVKDLSLIIKAGERLALVGRSGAGKSTLVKLLLRLYNLESGEIRIDGQPINKVTQASLRQAISYVPQEPLLFHRSIRENIAYGNPDASDRQVIAAAKRAHCHEFISRLPQKYESLVGERGVKLSGGERQRVAIARAMLKNAPILILDEATSALDPESEQLIQKAMEELMKGKTVIAIAHRLSTIRHMDRVIVLDQGMIADEGTHDELIARKTIYRDFWRRQTEGYRG